MIKNSHSTSELKYHIVLVTKYRKKVLQKENIETIINSATKLINLIEIGFEKDHVHLLIEAKPALAPSKIVQVIKQESSKLINLSNNNWKGWARGYFISAISENSIETVENYIKNQEGL